MGVLAIAAYAQYLGTFLLELAFVLPEQGDLVGSTTCEVEDVEGENYVLLPPVLTQADPLAILRWEAEVWGLLSHFRCH